MKWTKKESRKLALVVMMPLITASFAACAQAAPASSESTVDGTHAQSAANSASEAYDKGYAQGIADAKAESTTTTPSPIQVDADKHTGTVPNFVGQNLAQVGFWNENSLAVPVGHGGLHLRVVSSDGALVTEENAASYKVVSQDPAGGTTYKITYFLDDDGKEYDALVDSQGIEEVIVNVEPVAN